MEYKNVYLFYIYIIATCFYSVTKAQDWRGIRNLLLSPLAKGGMIKSLLEMQVRPRGGFYEEKYKKIFNDSSDNIERIFLEDYSAASNDSVSKWKVSKWHDGVLLKEASSGKAPNPCFEEERIHRNSLLALVCILQLKEALHV